MVDVYSKFFRFLNASHSFTPVCYKNLRFIKVLIILLLKLECYKEPTAQTHDLSITKTMEDIARIFIVSIYYTSQVTFTKGIVKKNRGNSLSLQKEPEVSNMV